jgi:hypothetical protein
LHIIHDRLQGTSVTWAVTGSLGFALQGVPVVPHDIDIQTDKDGAYEIERLLDEFVVERVKFSSAERIRSHFGVFIINAIRVEIMGDIEKRSTKGVWQPIDDLRKYVRFVEIDDMIIPVLLLEYEYEAYMQLGREDKARFLQNWLERRGGSVEEVSDG